MIGYMVKEETSRMLVNVLVASYIVLWGLAGLGITLLVRKRGGLKSE